jgi:Ca2+-transporting ATPase
MVSTNFNIHGLTTEQVESAREKYGQNKVEYQKEQELLNAVKKFFKDPMILLLLY